MALAGVSVTTTPYTADALSPDTGDVAASLAEERGQYGANGNGALPHGSITGLAKTVQAHVRKGAFSNQARVFLMFMHSESFGNAGYQRRNGRTDAGLWCDFDLGAWAQELGWAKPNVCRMREQVVGLGVVTYEPDTVRPGGGVLRWITDFTAWLPLRDDYRRQRSTRPGAGRPKKDAKLAGIINQNTSVQQASVIKQNTAEKQPGVINQITVTADEPYQPDWAKKIKLITKSNQTDNARMLSAQAPSGTSESLKKEERRKNIDTSVSIAAQAPAVAPATPSGSPLRKHKPYQRKLTDEQLAAHRAKMAYVAQVMAALKDNFFKHSPIPSEKEMRAAAAWFYVACDGAPVPADEVEAWYRAGKQTPFWAGKFLSLWTVTKFYSGNDGDLDAFRRSVEAERRGSSGGNGSGRQPARGGASSNGRPGSAAAGAGAGGGKWQPTHPDPSDDGEYADWPKVRAARERRAAHE